MAELVQRERRSAQTARTLAKISEILLSALSVDEVIAWLVNEASVAAGANMSLVIRVLGDEYTVTHVRRVRDDVVGVAKSSSDYPGFALAATTRQPVLIDDNFADPRTNKEFVIPHELRAFQLLPLVPEGVVTHVLALAYDQSQKFDAEDEQTAARMAAAMSAALRNARSYEDEQRRARRVALLKDLATIGASALSQGDTAERLVAAVATGMSAKTVALLVLDAGEQHLVPIGLHGYTPEYIAEHFGPLNVDGPGTSPSVFRSRTPSYIEDTERDPSLSETAREFNRRVGVRSGASAPLLVHGRPIGTISVEWEEPRSMDGSEIALLDSIASEIAIALTNARLFESLHEELVRTDLVRDVAIAASAETDLTLLGNRVLEAIEQHVGLQTGDLKVLDDNGRTLVLLAHRGYDQQMLKRVSRMDMSDAGYLTVRAVEEGRMLTHEDEELTPERSRVLEEAGLIDSRYFVAPIRYAGITLGALSLTMPGRRAFSADELQTFAVVMNVLGQSVQNARLFEAERRARETARQSARDLMRAQAVASVGSWRLDTRKNELAWSEETYRIFGVPQGQEMTYESFLSQVHPEDRDYVGDNWQAALRREREYDIEHRIVVGDAVKWVRERAELEFDESGSLLGGFGTVHDITSLKLTEIELALTAERLEILADSARLLLSAGHPEECVQAIAERVCEFLDCQAFFNYIIEDDRQGMRLNAYSGIPKKTAREIRHLDLGVAVCGCVGRDGERIIAEDIQNTSDERTGLVKSFGMQAYACHPLVMQGETIGTLSFGTKTRTSFSEDELDLMSVVADQAATAMARKRAEDQLRESRAAIAEERARLRSIIDQVPIGISLLDGDGTPLEINRASHAIWGGELPLVGGPAQYETYPAFHPDTGKPFDVDDWPATKTLKTEKQAEALAEVHRLDGGTAMVRMTTSPIRDEAGRMTGVVGLGEDVTEQVESQRLNEALAGIATAIGATLDFEEILHRLVESSAIALGVDTGGLTVRRDDKWAVREFFGMPKRRVTSAMADHQLALTVLAAKEHRPIAINDVEADPRVNPDVMRSLGICSLLAIPLVVQKSVVGVLIYHHRKRTKAFTPAQVDFATKLMATAALALENARLYERERMIADTLQEAILTPLPEIAGLSSAYLYRPASSIAAVGGDFYDLFDIPGGRVGIVVGDVSGKGLEAARLTSLVRDGIRAYAYERSDPAWVLERVNGLVYRSSHVGAFATVFFAVLDSELNSLAYCGAGHPPPALYHETEVRFLAEAACPIVGAFPVAEYSAMATEFLPGDRLLMYTDGVNEARRDGEQFGAKRLVRSVKKLRRRRIERVPEALLGEVEEFTGGPLQDDIVIMAVERILGDEQ